VRAIYDGAQALEAGRTFQPDVALLDLGLPGIDGYQLALHLRREAGPRENRLDCCKPDTIGRMLRARSREYGFSEHFVKPGRFGAPALIARPRSRHTPSLEKTAHHVSHLVKNPANSFAQLQEGYFTMANNRASTIEIDSGIVCENISE